MACSNTTSPLRMSLLLQRTNICFIPGHCGIPPDSFPTMKFMYENVDTANELTVEGVVMTSEIN